MRQVGSRRERPLAYRASGQLLIEGARFSEAVFPTASSTAGDLAGGEKAPITQYTSSCIFGVHAQ